MENIFGNKNVRKCFPFHLLCVSSALFVYAFLSVPSLALRTFYVRSGHPILSLAFRFVSLRFFSSSSFISETENRIEQEQAHDMHSTSSSTSYAFFHTYFNKLQLSEDVSSGPIFMIDQSLVDLSWGFFFLVSASFFSSPPDSFSFGGSFVLPKWQTACRIA